MDIILREVTNLPREDIVYYTMLMTISIESYVLPLSPGGTDANKSMGNYSML